MPAITMHMERSTIRCCMREIEDMTHTQTLKLDHARASTQSNRRVHEFNDITTVIFSRENEIKDMPPSIIHFSRAAPLISSCVNLRC